MRRSSSPENAPPATIKDVKVKVEEDLSIPSCVQRLTYEAYPLSDCTNLEVAKIRSGDTFQVSYSEEGNCKGVRKVVKWLELVQEFLEKEDPNVNNPMSKDLEKQVMLGDDEELMENLAFEYFIPREEHVNKLYFVQCGGLDVIMRVYALLHRQPWTRCELPLKLLEQSILQVLWHFGQTFQQRRLIVARDGLKLCIQSLLRQRLEKEGERIEDKTNVAFHQMNSWVLVDTIWLALGLLCP